jgi:hypothetical protein
MHYREILRRQNAAGAAGAPSLAAAPQKTSWTATQSRLKQLIIS